LLAQWAALDARPFAFVALESSDNDPTELWSNIVCSLRQIHPSIGASVEASLRSFGAVAVQSIVRRVAADLEQLTEPIVLALEDVHVIKNPTCLASLESLVAHPASLLMIALSTRADPPIPFGRIRTSGELIEIRAADLAFTADETEEILNGVIGLSLTAADLALLHERTEGWPAGLHLASLGLRTTDDPAGFLRSFGGSNRHVVDYLAEVVIDALDEDVRTFLLETSVLSELCSALCDAVTGREGSAEMLEVLDRSNLFVIPLDDHRRWYRYHRLFGELLAEQLQTRFPSWLQHLHRAAAVWMKEAGDVNGAILHSIAAGELEAATDLVARNWPVLAGGGRVVTLLDQLDAFPEGHVESEARLSLARAWTMGVLGQQSEARRSLNDALSAGYSQPLPDGSGTVEQSAAVLRSRFPWGNVGELRDAARAVNEFRGSLTPRYQAVAAFGNGMANFLSGEYGQETRVELDLAAEMATDLGLWVTVVNCLGFRAHLALAENKADEAESFGRHAIDMATTHGHADLPHVGYYEAAYGAGVARSGRLAEGDGLLEHGIAQLGDFDPVLCAHARLLHVPVRSQLGDTEGARALLDEAKAQLAECDDPGVVADLGVQVARALSTSRRQGTERSEITDREMDVLRLLDNGLSQHEIANELFLSFHTIHSHTKRLYAKLDASSRDKALARAREQGIL
jgi:LuxR family maltose regulon positive regulatory protein